MFAARREDGKVHSVEVGAAVFLDETVEVVVGVFDIVGILTVGLRVLMNTVLHQIGYHNVLLIHFIAHCISLAI